MKFSLLLLAITALAQPPTRILVSYYSETGNTEKLAQSIGKGAAAVDGVEVTVRKAADVKDDDIVRYDGIIFGAPVYWGGLATGGKQFLDRVGAALWKAKTNGDGRTAGVFCTGGAVASGKEMARLSMIAAFLGMRFTIVGGVEADGFGTLGPQATTGPGAAGVDVKAQDEGRQFGERFARYTRRFRGRQ